MLSKLLSNISKSEDVSAKEVIKDKKGEGSVKASQQVFQSLLQSLQNDGSSSQKKQFLMVDNAEGEGNAKNPASNVLGGSFLSVGDEKVAAKDSKSSKLAEQIKSKNGKTETKNGEQKADRLVQLKSDSSATSKETTTKDKVSGGNENTSDKKNKTVEAKEGKNSSKESKAVIGVVGTDGSAKLKKGEPKPAEQKAENPGEVSSGEKMEGAKAKKSQEKQESQKAADKNGAAKKKKVALTDETTSNNKAKQSEASTSQTTQKQSEDVNKEETAEDGKKVTVTKEGSSSYTAKESKLKVSQKAQKPSKAADKDNATKEKNTPGSARQKQADSKEQPPSADDDIQQPKQKADSRQATATSKNVEQGAAKANKTPRDIRAQLNTGSKKKHILKKENGEKLVVKEKAEQDQGQSKKKDASGPTSAGTAKRSKSKTSPHPHVSKKSLPDDPQKQSLKFRSVSKKRANKEQANKKVKQPARSPVPRPTSSKMSFKGQEIETGVQKKAKKKSDSNKKQKVHSADHSDNNKRRKFLSRLGITNTQTQKKVRPVDFQGLSAVKPDQSDMSLDEQKQMWEKQVSKSLEAADDKQTKANNATTSSMKLGRLPVTNINLRRKILPGLTKSLKKAAASAQKNPGDWQKHTFKLDGDKNIQLSVRESKGVLHVKMGSLNVDLSKLLQQNLQRIRHHLKQEFGSEINLQFEGQGQQQSQQEYSQSSQSHRRNYRSGSPGKSNISSEKLVEAQDKSIRNFGYNKMEWTA